MLKPSEFEYLNGCPDPPNGLRAQRFDFHELFGSSVSFFRDQDATCISHLLHAICEVHIRARGIIRLVNSVLYRLNNDFTGVDTNADLQIWIAEACYPILHCQRRQAAADSVILKRLGRAEKRHDSIALRLVDDA